MARSMALWCGGLALAALTGCPPGGQQGADAGGSEDAGPVNTVIPSCNYDTDCGIGEICNDASHRCVAGHDCSGASATVCGFCDDGSVDCGFGQFQAICDGNAGVCRRIHTSCQPCHSDGECTPDDAMDMNKCLQYDDGQFCGVNCAVSHSCPRGFFCDPLDEVCHLSPDLGRCSDAVGCTAATEGGICPTGTYCSTRDFPDRTGVCLAVCLTDDDCVAPQICRTDPGDGYGLCADGCSPFGPLTSDRSLMCHENGRRGDSCANNADCLTITGTAGFECVMEAGPCDPTPGCTRGWCASAGCQSSAECPLPRTYCDTSTSECIDGCGDSGDCGAFEVCESHACHAQPCRGKDLSCNLEQWCCGKELYDGSSVPEHMPCPDGVAFGACFPMQDPYCRQCEDNDGCSDIDQFGYASYCFELKKQDAQGNEVSLGKYCSVGCETNADCPRGIQCVQDLPDGNGGTVKGCIDARCVP